MEWMTAKEIAELWGISDRQVEMLCSKGRIDGATRLGNMWVIPKGQSKPIDGRTKAARQLKEGKQAGCWGLR
ncbi:MAG: helix-turn-helix domain-containing protein [Clostridiales bacterium]|jgi:excisionase family DNA binding protein|nr:helix-turn-helix domain-containing protein [Clostridiales bacterium]